MRWLKETAKRLCPRMDVGARAAIDKLPSATSVLSAIPVESRREGASAPFLL